MRNRLDPDGPIRLASPPMNDRGTLLLVEDDPDDAYFVTRAFRKIRPQVSVSHVRDGEAAEQYLAGEREYGDRTVHPIPSLVLLDIKLPRISGLELLAWIRSRPEHQALPVVVLSSSEREIADARRLGILAYHLKPVEASELEQVAESVCRSWKELAGGDP